MAERDRVIKSGQLTLPRLLFLAVIGGLIVATVALGGVWLTVGYWLLTIAICVLLYLVATDYGIKMDKVDLTGQSAQSATVEAAPIAETVRTVSSEARVKRRTARPVKRRR
jgi:type VI protein secretion system component VasK